MYVYMIFPFEYVLVQKLAHPLISIHRFFFLLQLYNI